jgi:hypothetical protein
MKKTTVFPVASTLIGIAALFVFLGIYNSQTPYPVAKELCGSFATTMAKQALGRMLGGQFEDSLNTRLGGLKLCREAYLSGCPSDEFVTKQAQRAWNMAVEPEEVGQVFYDECTKAKHNVPLQKKELPQGPNS